MKFIIVFLPIALWIILGHAADEEDNMNPKRERSASYNRSLEEGLKDCPHNTTVRNCAICSKGFTENQSPPDSMSAVEEDTDYENQQQELEHAQRLKLKKSAKNRNSRRAEGSGSRKSRNSSQDSCPSSGPSEHRESPDYSADGEETGSSRNSTRYAASESCSDPVVPMDTTEDDVGMGAQGDSRDSPDFADAEDTNTGTDSGNGHLNFSGATFVRVSYRPHLESSYMSTSEEDHALRSSASNFLIRPTTTVDSTPSSTLCPAAVGPTPVHRFQVTKVVEPTEQQQSVTVSS